MVFRVWVRDRVRDKVRVKFRVRVKVGDKARVRVRVRARASQWIRGPVQVASTIKHEVMSSQNHHRTQLSVFSRHVLSYWWEGLPMMACQISCFTDPNSTMTSR